MSKESKQSNKESAAAEPFSLKELKSIFELVSKHEVTEFQLERGGDCIMMKRGPEELPQAPQPSSAIHQVFSQMPAASQSGTPMASGNGISATMPMSAAPMSAAAMSSTHGAGNGAGASSSADSTAGTQSAEQAAEAEDARGISMK